MEKEVKNNENVNIDIEDKNVNINIDNENIDDESIYNENNKNFDVDENSKDTKNGDLDDKNDDKSDENDDKSNEKSDKLKNLFGRKKDKKDEEIEKLKDKYTRQLAEFENFRKRSESEKAKMFDVGAISVIEKLLPILDNFERGLGTINEEQKDDAFVKGIDQVYKQMLNTLKELHVEAIDAINQEFNPDLHNAVMHVEDENYGNNVVVEEMMKGYKYKDSVVRYSMVKVAN